MIRLLLIFVFQSLPVVYFPVTTEYTTLIDVEYTTNVADMSTANTTLGNNTLLDVNNTQSDNSSDGEYSKNSQNNNFLFNMFSFGQSLL